MKLILQHCKNVDLMHGQGNGTGYWQPPTDPTLMKVEVASLKEARQAFIAWRDRNGLGGGNMTKHAGEVFECARDEKYLWRISYNGRVWGASGNEVQIPTP